MSGLIVALNKQILELIKKVRVKSNSPDLEDLKLHKIENFSQDSDSEGPESMIIVVEPDFSGPEFILFDPE